MELANVLNTVTERVPERRSNFRPTEMIQAQNVPLNSAWFTT